MRQNIADAVHSILSQGLALRARLAAGERLQLAVEHAKFKELLALLVPENPDTVAGDENYDFDFSDLEDPEDPIFMREATICYALTCWLDELMVRYSPEGEAWGNPLLELDLYGTQLRAEKFWQEAHYAEMHHDLDALEVLYWCVMLGFRGAWEKQPRSIEAWAKRIRAVLDRSALDREEELPTQTVPSLEDLPNPQRAYRSMVFTLFMTFSWLVPIALLLYWRKGWMG